MLKPREPNQTELEELRGYLVNQGHEREQAQGLVEDAAIACFDQYSSDGPGYSGTVLVVVWSGGPEIVESYTFSHIGIEQAGPQQ